MNLYRDNLQSGIDFLEMDIAVFSRDVCDKQRELDNTMRIIPYQATITADEAFEKVGECPLCSDLVQSAREELFAINHSQEAFVKTRGLLDLEDQFVRLWIERGLLEDYDQVLDNALDEGDSEPEYPPTSEEPRPRHGSQDCRDIQEIVECDPVMHDVAQILVEFRSHENPFFHRSHYSEYDKFGYCKKCVVQTIRNYIQKVETLTKKSSKINEVNNLFEYLSKDAPQKFLKSFPKFVNTIKDRLFFFRDMDGIRRANVWWRRVFHERMPVEKEHT